jgi:iron complex outermembrane receptor protein
MKSSNKFHLFSSACVVVLFSCSSAYAQSNDEEILSNDNPGDIIVTATKRAGGVTEHNAALSITALGETQLRSANIISVADVAGLAPNVLLNTSNAAPNINNFSIRGMGVYSSIPSSTSTVGVFVDGMYIGSGPGTGLKTFDLAGIEVLRGPQGLLFGRNVTAGAIIVHTSEPKDVLTVRAEAGVETGPSFTESLVVSGPIVADGLLSAKVGLYRNDDDGWFTNLADGKSFGQSTTNIFRAALSTQPSDRLRSILRYEYGNNSSDGAANQNQGIWKPGTFDLAISRQGFAKGHYQQLISETTLDVGFGDGEIVNIAGWRKIQQKSLNDNDGLIANLFNFGLFTRHHQISDELRYSGTFGAVTATVGGFIYSDTLHYVESRDFHPPIATPPLTGGGDVESKQFAAFSNFDIELPSNFTLNVGGRYSVETKEGSVQVLTPTATNNPCSFSANLCTSFLFNDKKTWRAFTPKVGLQWKPTDDTHIYGYWARGNRSGGYNVRQAAAFVAPGPYDMETQDAFELGLKQRFLDGRMNINIVGFLNKYSDIQRDVNIVDPALGSYQITTNTGDMKIKGVELDVSWAVTPEFTLNAFYGHISAYYTSLRYGFLLRGPVSPADFDLKIPFAPSNSAGASANYKTEIGGWNLAGRLSYAYQQRAPANDLNTAYTSPINELSANISINRENGIGVSLYGKNLLNKATWGLSTPSPFNPNGTFTPLNKGRVLGIRLTYDFGR